MIRLKFPKLKMALLCRILVYVVVIGCGIAPVVAVLSIKVVPDIVEVIVSLGSAFGLVIYIYTNFFLLMAMDFALAMQHCQNTARKRFYLHPSFSKQMVSRKLSHFGQKCEPTAISPHPDDFRYKSNASMTVFSSGIEKIIVSYHTDYLDKDRYHRIFMSAIANSKSVAGKKRHHVDKSQKNAPLNRATVIIIYAKQVDSNLNDDLFELVCKDSGDGLDTAVLPCVVDLENRICTFDSLRIPYMGFQYPVKNRGVRIIRKYLFNNRFTFAKSPYVLETKSHLDPEQSLWSFWKSMKRELISTQAEAKKRYGKMKHREITFENGYIYLKWEDRGIWVSAELNDETKEVEVDVIDSWYYPKANKIGKQTVTEIKSLINAYFADLGYSVKYLSYD